VPTPLVRARILAPLLAPVLALLLPLGLAACSQKQAQARLEARLAASDPPRLWRVQSLAADGGVTGEVLVCADAATRAGFDRANAEVNGAPASPREPGWSGRACTPTAAG
jgi:hypothetical protein